MAIPPTIQIDPEKKVLAINISGDLNSTSVRECRTQIESALTTLTGPAPCQWVTLNLATAKMVDSMGLNLVVSIYKAVHKAGGRMQVFYTSQNVQRTFHFTPAGSANRTGQSLTSLPRGSCCF